MRRSVIIDDSIATGQGKDRIPRSNDVSQHPVDAVACGVGNDKALLVSDTIKVAAEDAIAELVQPYQFATRHVRSPGKRLYRERQR
jgi:hypothetical protein